jgi:hypothetical protein
MVAFAGTSTLPIVLEWTGSESPEASIHANLRHFFKALDGIENFEDYR